MEWRVVPVLKSGGIMIAIKAERDIETRHDY